MWDLIRADASTITALIAVLGFVLAAVLGFISIRSSGQAMRAQANAHLDSVLINFVQSINRFQHTELLPYWKSTPVDPESKEAQKVHESVTVLKTNAAVYSRATLRELAPEITNVMAATWALYESALYGNRQEKDNFSLNPEGGYVQQTANAWRSVEGVMKHRDASVDFIDSAKSTVLREYKNDSGVIQVADMTLDLACDELITAYTTLDVSNVYIRGRKRPARQALAAE